MRFRPASEIQGVHPTTNVWRAFQLLDENGNETDYRARQKKWDTGFPVEFDRAGQWLVAMEIHVRDKAFNLGTHVRVLDPAKLAATGAATMKPLDFREFRFNLAYRTLVDYGVQKDQSATAPRDENKQARSYIISDAPSDPMEAQAYNANGILFRVVPHPDAVSFKWHQYFDNPGKHPAKHFSGGSFNDLGTGRTQRILLDRPDLYTIICEQFDKDGHLLPTARYLQSVLLGHEWKQAKKWVKYIEGVDRLIEDIDPQTRQEIPGAYVNVATGEAIPLAVYTGKSKTNPKQHVVLDLMFGIGPKLTRLRKIYGSTDAIPATELAKAAEALENKMRDVIKHWTVIFGDKLK